MIEGSGSVSLTSGSGSRRPKDPQHWINDYSYTVFGTLRDFLVSMSPSLMAGQRDSGTYIREHAEHFWPCTTAKKHWRNSKEWTKKVMFVLNHMRWTKNNLNLLHFK
jgi:hypothetical protein